MALAAQAQADNAGKIIAVDFGAGGASDAPCFWAWVLVNVGIYRILDIWGADAWRDPDTGEPRRGHGILTRVQSSDVEPAAINNLRQQAEAWASAKGRDFITPFEKRCLDLEAEYMQGCQTDAFRKRWGDRYAARKYRMQWVVDQREITFEENEIDAGPCHAWVAMRLATDKRARVFVAPHEVKAAIVGAARVYTLLATLGQEPEPEVRDIELDENRYQLAS